ncbi:hypothetical protein LSAT2_016996 [Lamellibrachia satsuma]|nr:hypothetical protein LSAT2_016996 [Lamellibrachia satsuma]
MLFAVHQKTVRAYVILHLLQKAALPASPTSDDILFVLTCLFAQLSRRLQRSRSPRPGRRTVLPSVYQHALPIHQSRSDCLRLADFTWTSSFNKADCVRSVGATVLHTTHT